MADHPEGLDLSREQALLVVCSTQVCSWTMTIEHYISHAMSDQQASPKLALEGLIHRVRRQLNVLK